MGRRSIGATLALVSVVAGLVLVGIDPASGATGDKVKTVIGVRDPASACKSVDATGNMSGSVYATGIAFDGTNLLLSCHQENVITFVDPADGSFVKKLDITGASNPGAMAYDGLNHKLFLCSADDNVGTVDLTTGVFTSAFTSGGCLDGLAYDGKDNTIWASDDASTTVNHYTITGTLIASATVDLGGHGNSGLAVGGDSLYLGNDGGAEVWQASKTDLPGATVFIDSAKTAGRRVEDLECDNVTFASQGKAVMWVQDAYDNILEAYEIPQGSCAFGGGVTTTTTAPTTTAAPTTTVKAVTTTTAAAEPATAVPATPVFTG